MKKTKTAIRFLEIIILIFILTGCDMKHSKFADSEIVICHQYTGSNYFKTLSIEKEGSIVYDTRTGVEYWISSGMYNYGSLTLLVDKDGRPLIYTEK